MDNIQLTLESSTTSLSLNSDSIYLNPEIDGLAGLPEIRTTSGVNAGYNGGWTSAQFYDARLITIRGVISDSDISVVEDRRKALVGLLGQGRKEELTLHFVTAGGNSYVLNCRTISCEMALSGLARKQEFLIQLRADDPLIYDDGALATEAIVNVRRALGGFQIDFGLPLYIGGGVNETLVENGNETVYPVINLYGPLHSPTIINQTTNQQMQVLTDLDYALTWVNPVEVTGDYILVTNETDKESPLSSVELLGNTTQDTLSGKNLFDVSTTPWVDKVAYDSSGNKVSWSGYYGISEYQPVQPNTTYTFSNSTNKAIYYGLVYYDTNKTKLSNITASTTTFTTPANCYFVRFAIQNDSAPTWTQLELGSTATAYEQFCGGIPSPNPDFPQAVQTTTGEQVVKVMGKNVLDVSRQSSATISDVSVEYDASTQIYTLNGTSTSNNTGFKFVNSDINLDGTYTLSFEVLGGSISNISGTTRIQLANSNWSQNIYLNLGNSSASTTKTVSFFATQSNNGVRYDNGVTFNNYKFRIQLEKNSQATEWEAYHQQSYEVNLGKNLFDKDNAEIVHIYNASTASKANESAWSIILPCEPNQTYTYSNTAPTQMKSDSSVGFYTDKPNVADVAKLSSTQFGQNATETFTAPAGANWMLIYYLWASSDKPSAYAGMMIELGSTATTYAAYFTPIELCKLGDYQDKIYKSGDDWFVHREVGKTELSSSWNWYYNSSTHGFSIPFVADRNWGAYTGYCSHARIQESSSTWAGVGECGWNAGNTFWFEDGGKVATSAAGFKTWLDSNIVSVYYVLATPTDTTITDQTLIAQLEALASSTLYAGVNNISLVPSGGAQGELSIDYSSAYTEERDIVVIDSQARTITKNGADIYYLKADGSEFPTLAPGENTLYLTSEQTSDEGYAEIKFKQGYLSI